MKNNISRYHNFETQLQWSDMKQRQLYKMRIVDIARNEKMRKIKYKNLKWKSVLKFLTTNGYNSRVYFVAVEF